LQSIKVISVVVVPLKFTESKVQFLKYVDVRSLFSKEMFLKEQFSA
jgi:hypothetical protein